MGHCTTTLTPSHRNAGGRSRAVRSTMELALFMLRGWLLERATVRALSALDDRTLKDIGLFRGEIGGVARQTRHRSLVAVRHSAQEHR